MWSLAVLGGCINGAEFSYVKMYGRIAGTKRSGHNNQVKGGVPLYEGLGTKQGLNHRKQLSIGVESGLIEADRILFVKLTEVKMYTV